MRTISIRRRAIMVATVGALSLSVMPTWAAPVPSSTALIKSVAATNVVDVGWRGRGFGRGIGAGIAAGAALGIIAGIAQSRPYYYYDPVPAYGAPYYADPYYPAPPMVYEVPPAYATPDQAYIESSQFYVPPRPGAVRQCWVATDDARGFGYWRPC